MTPVDELMDRLRRMDIRIALDGERVTINAPKGALTTELRAELGRLKGDIIQHLRNIASVSASAGAVAGSSLSSPRRATGRTAPSHMQRRIWFIKQFDPATAVYNVPATFRMTGALDESAFEKALDDLVRRHESLRTRFFAEDGTPYCSVELEVKVVLERADFSDMTPDQGEVAAKEAVHALARRPFDIGRAPLMHVLLVRLAPDRHLFSFVLDHIISDGLSLGIFLLDFGALYTQNLGGTSDPLPPLPMEYLDYVEWERTPRAQEALAEHLGFWTRQLAGLPPLLNLPTDRPRQAILTSNGGRITLQMPPALGRQLKALARGEGATLFMVLLSAFYVLLHRHSGETDIAVGSAVANRNRSEVDRVIGFFANNIVLRGDLSGRPTVRQLIARTREMAVSAYAHQAVPFDVIVDALAGRRELDHSPLFQVMFVLQSVQATTMELPALVCEPVEQDAATARFDLSVDVFDIPQGLRVYFEYNTDLFDTSTIQRMTGHFQNLLEEFVARPDAQVDTLRILTEAEQSQLVLDWNRTAAPLPAAPTLHAMFEEQVRRSPDAVALRFEAEQLCYGELNSRANRLASRLRSLGVAPDDLVGVWIERSVDMIVALLGVLKAGAAYVPLDPGFPRDRIEFMMDDADLSIVVTEGRLADTLPADSRRVICMDRDREQLSREPSMDLVSPVTGRNLAYVIYTSGSTGRPKGVQIEHRAIVNFLASMHREPGIGASDRFVSVTTLSFDIAGLEIHGPLTAGGTLILASRATSADGTRLAELVDRERATLLQATPATWRLLLESGWQGRAGLKMLCGGEALPQDLARKLASLGGGLWNLYGPTETTVWSTMCVVSDTARPVPIGRPIANTQVYVLEPGGLPAPIGVGGELCIAGDGLARGYRKRPELTAEKFVSIDVPGVGVRRVYRTGDVVRFQADGQLQFTGRRDHQVKVRGFRIELGEIESVLGMHPGIAECVVQVREDTPGDQRLVGYVVPEAGKPFEVDAARATLRARLPEYMIPNLFVALPALPLTPNGKVDRKALPAPGAVPQPPASEADALMTPLQRRVADAWRAVLGIDHVGLNANFFDIGGHSLLLVRLQSSLQREFGREFPLIDLFQRTTIAAQAEHLATAATPESALKRAQDRAARQMKGRDA